MADALSTSHKAPVVTLSIRRTDSDGPERVVSLEGSPVLIGRSPTCAINLADQTVSRLHAEITLQDDGTWAISRSKPEQRVWVNGVSIDTVPLRGGETIRIGPYTLRFRLGEHDGDTAEPIASDPAAGTVSKPRRSATLVIETGSLTSGRLPLVKPTTLIGESEGCDVILVARTGVAEHAAVHRVGDGFVLGDLGGTNGVFLNGHRITSDTELAGGDIIDIGAARMSFVVDGDGGSDVFAAASTPRPVVNARGNPLLRMVAAWQRWPAAWQVGTAATVACAIVAMATIPAANARRAKQMASATPRQTGKKPMVTTPSAAPAEEPPSTPAGVGRDAAPPAATPDSPAEGSDPPPSPPDPPQPPASQDGKRGSRADGDRTARPPRSTLKDLLDQAEQAEQTAKPPAAATTSPEPEPEPDSRRPNADAPDVAIESEAPGPTTRLPVPPPEEVAAALEKVDAVYEEEFSATGQAAALVSKLIDAARKSVKPANKFALLLAAEREAVKAASFRAAIDALIARAEAFDVDALQARLDLLIDASKATGASAGDVLDLVIDVAHEALADERFDVATKASTLASTVAADLDQAAKAKAVGGVMARPAPPADPSSVAAEPPVDIARRLRHLVTETKKLHQKYETALATLQDSPEDEKSLEIVGKYRCFVRGDWPAGLPALAASGEEPLCDLAARELELVSGSAETAAIFTLAGEWWSFADAVKRSPLLPVETESVAKKHAADLYARIVKNLDDPLEAELARKRMASAAAEVRQRRPMGR